MKSKPRVTDDTILPGDANRAISDRMLRALLDTAEPTAETKLVLEDMRRALARSATKAP